MPRKAIVIGAGIAGIATAIRLQLKGYGVEVMEAAARPGGKLNEIRLDGYRFDAGPSLFTMPHLVDELFRLAGKDPAPYFQYRTLPLACRYFWEDGTVFDAWTDPDRFAGEAEKVLNIPGSRVRKYLSHTLKLYESTAPFFLEKSLHRPASFLDKRILKTVSHAFGLDLLKTMDQANRARLGHPKLVQVFNRMATYNGSSPYRASGVLNVIAGLEHGSGAYFPEGGMYRIATSMVKLAEELGVVFHTGTPVERILLEGRKAAGVRVAAGTVSAGLVVSNMDVVPTYTRLLRGEHMPRHLLRQERSSSALIFYWGMNRKFPALDAHNIFFSDNYPEEFRVLFRDLDVSGDPTVYLHISSRNHAPDAPEHGENWFVMLNVPHNAGQDWDAIIARLRGHVIRKVSRILGEDIGTAIAAEDILDPRSIESRTSSYLGSLYGSSSNHWRSAFLRHPNFSARIPGLYFAGGSVHPGGGIPLCLLSAKITTELIKPAS